MGSVAQVISPCEAGFVLNTSKGPAHPWRRLPFFLQVVRYFQEVKLVLHTLPSKCVSVSASQRHNCAQWTMLLLAQRADRYLARRLRKIPLGGLALLNESGQGEDVRTARPSENMY